MLDRVGEQVVERLRHPAWVRHRHRGPSAPAQLERAAGLRGTTAPALDGGFDQRPASHRAKGEGARRAVDLTVEVVERGKRQLRRGWHRGPAR